MCNKLVFLFVLFLNVVAVIDAQQNLVCYFASSAWYRPGAGKFNVEDIDPNLCTHMLYSFAGADAYGFIKPLDSWNDINNQGFARIHKLKQQNPRLKTLISVGGWDEGSTKYSVIAANPQYRRNFINSAMNFMNYFQFNGINIDWEYPGQRGGASSDKINFAILIEEFRRTIGSRYLLTISAGASPFMVDTSYNVPKIAKNVDFINLMTYDLHGHWEGRTGANSPLYSLQATDPLSVSRCVSYWILKGALRSKINVGIPVYGRTFTLRYTSQNNVGAPTIGPGKLGPYTQQIGILGYNEIYELLTTNQWFLKWDDIQKVPYMHRGDQWISYDNERSVSIKANYSKAQGLGGVAVWSIDTDPTYFTLNGRNPIINKIKQSLL